MNETAFVYSPHLSDYQLSESHPFKPIRLELTRSLLHHAGLLSEAQEVHPEPFSESQLHTLHDPHYVEVVKAVSKGRDVADAYAHGLGTSDNPIFPGMHDAILGICAATATAVDLVASGKKQRATNISGGLHHAMRGKTSGFCTYNDLALGIEQADWAPRRARRLYRPRRAPRRRCAVDVLRTRRSHDDFHARVGALPLSGDRDTPMRSAKMRGGARASTCP